MRRRRLCIPYPHLSSGMDEKLAASTANFWVVCLVFAVPVLPSLQSQQARCIPLIRAEPCKGAQPRWETTVLESEAGGHTSHQRGRATRCSPGTLAMISWMHVAPHNMHVEPRTGPGQESETTVQPVPVSNLGAELSSNRFWTRLASWQLWYLHQSWLLSDNFALDKMFVADSSFESCP